MIVEYMLHLTKAGQIELTSMIKNLLVLAARVLEARTAAK